MGRLIRTLSLACIVPVFILLWGCSKSNPASSLSAPVITQQPLSQTVTDSEKNVTFTVKAIGNPALTYQWRKDSVNISGESDSCYTISSIHLADTGTYSVVVSNSQGSVTSSGAVLTVDTAVTPTGVSIAAGTFLMGSTDTNYKNQQPRHSVSVSTFYMDTTEVTQASYYALMGINPSYFTGDSLRPVESVTWFDAVLYCNRRSKHDLLDTVYSYISVTGTPGNGCTSLNGLAIDFSKHGYRLPTEAEWEYACRDNAGDSADYYWGGNYPPTTHADTAVIDSNAVWWHNFSGVTERVHTKLPNARRLYDMIGNVQEYCNDWYAASYDSTVHTDPTGPSASTGLRVLRGGSWLTNDANNLRSASRTGGSPDFRSYITGLRCVRR
ncbi:MAG: SUMF1/EgtB/PvdO family nonheme iron enzyme [Chitinispirillaceae bacterium]|jgi:formylglycine-generating enzyme required for sulfatase activity